MTMSSQSDPILTLTDEQRRIVDADVSARLLVTAGPGTGKTHTLLARIAALIEEHELSPGQELLVLSFSRAAVYEVRRRTATFGGAVRYVRAVTFDSFATQLLMEFAPEADLSRYDYDGRIEIAHTLLETSEDLQGHIAQYRHIFVDEVQDLVGIRAAFVLKVLSHCSGGFTVLGDPAQGIYTFQLEGRQRMVGAVGFYHSLRNIYGADLQEISLTVNHRALSATAKAALWAGPLLNADNPDYPYIKTRLEEVIAGQPTLGALNAAVTTLRQQGRKTAILCRTNGQALVVSGVLWNAGVRHVLQRRAVDRVVPAWIAATVRGLEQTSIGRTALLERLTALHLPEGLTPEAAYRLIWLIGGRKKDAVDLRKVAENIRIGNIPDELLERLDDELVVSTIHRAKGLEFDRVIVGDAHADDDMDPAELAEETRVLYVALTRPRRRLEHIELPKTTGLRRHGEVDRWVVYQYMKKNFKAVTCCEVKGTDIHSEDPAGTFQFDGDGMQIQLYLEHEVSVGDPVILRRLETHNHNGERRFYYLVEHKNRSIGVTSDAFAQTLYKVLKLSPAWKVNWPIHIDNLFVEGVDTVAGSDASGRHAGLGSSGLWLRVRVAGLGRMRFEKV